MIVYEIVTANGSVSVYMVKDLIGYDNNYRRWAD